MTTVGAGTVERSRRHAADRGSPSLRARLVLLAIVGVVVVEVLRIGAGVSGAELASSWQLLDVAVLEDDPLRGVWYLHTQPPLFNLVVGLLAWSPLPLAGALLALDVCALLVVAFGLQDLLVRWGVPVVGATIAAAVAVANPSLLTPSASPAMRCWSPRWSSPWCGRSTAVAAPTGRRLARRRRDRSRAGA